MKNDGSLDFAQMLRMLAQPEAFPFSLPTAKSVPIIQTHASAVLLTPNLVYKLKKPKDFGFFDYSTPTLRRHFCLQEVALNAPLAPHIYHGIAPILFIANAQVHFGEVYVPQDLPAPGIMLGGGQVIDFSVVMARLPDEATLASMVQKGRATISLLSEIARHIARFHGTATTNEHIARFGDLACIRGNWEENFSQVQPYLGQTITAETNDIITGYVRQFIKDRAALFTNRVREQRIRDCHGDLRLQHIYVLDKEKEADPQLSRFTLLDRIEFNERFRYSDVASEIAFLVMELDAAGRSDLARAFVDTYITETGDESLRELLPFYCCYRAYVRGKAHSFQLDEPEVPAAQRQAASQAAIQLFTLAAHYASGSAQPTVIMIGGLMGTGKSTLALALQHETGWSYFSSDAARKHLAQIDPTQPQASAFNQGIYTTQWTDRTYATLSAHTGHALANGHSVIIDASFLRRSDRQILVRVARNHGAQALFIECLSPREVVLKRLAQRWKRRSEGSVPLASSTSDGRPELYDAQCTCWEPFVPNEEPDLRALTITTTTSLSICIEQVLVLLQLPRLCCWLRDSSDLRASPYK